MVDELAEIIRFGPEQDVNIAILTLEWIAMLVMLQIRASRTKYSDGYTCTQSLALLLGLILQNLIALSFA